MKFQTDPVDSQKLILPKSLFLTCLIDGATANDVALAYPGPRCGIYYLEQFDSYLRLKHNMGIRDYCIKILELEWPKCPVSGELLGFKLFGRGLVLSRFKRGCGTTKESNPEFKAACERFSKERRGSGNPMFGKAAWNTGLTKETSSIMQAVADARVGTKASEDTRAKQRLARALSLKKARHTTKHSGNSIQKMRVATASLHSRGVFKKSQIHLKVRALLERLEIRFREEYLFGFYSLDFAIPDRKIAIEVDGDYFHCHPEKYPNGPKDQRQLRNWGRDKEKDSALRSEGWTIVRYWERDINAADFERRLECDCRKLSLLKK